ncbi:uncharacterized protein LOC130648176 [Hydractinia symbiolongicarpus]|uniref:uncharacterized protein LOC130648176 n=1 Tax=Hydractinia symbiolongicarpus TaxID=13093 RepID=UPI00254F3B31|nr:uncharacterized protein LOC130648176 [Hydractinia symbiolongicarpus]
MLISIHYEIKTKLNESFPTNQFLIQGYNAYRFDRNGNGGGMILCVRNDIPSKLLKPKCESIVCLYNPKTNLIAQNLNHISKNIDSFSCKYENYVILGDFNAEISNLHVNEFLTTYKLNSLIKEPTCFKSIDNPTNIDLILTNHPRSFCHSRAIETGLSDFHKLTMTVLKANFAKRKPKIKNYRAYRNFNNVNFRHDIMGALNDDKNLDDFKMFENFKNSVLSILDNAPRKKRYVRHNQAAFMSKEINKAIMKRSKPLNKHRKDKTPEIENGTTISHDKDITEIFNNYFGSVVENLGIKSSNIQPSNVEKYIRKLDPKKAQQKDDIPTNIIKENSDIFSQFITENFNQSLKSSEFATSLKNADITPTHKKGLRTEKANYRPVSVLSNISKIYERCMYDQIYTFFEPLFSKLQFGFRKGHSSQQCLISMIEKWKNSLDKGGTFGALLTDLSKAFDCIPHELLLAKLHAYGFDMNSLLFIESYLIDRKQRTTNFLSRNMLISSVTRQARKLVRLQVRYGIETLSNVGLKLWNSLPNEYRNAVSLLSYFASCGAGTQLNMSCGATVLKIKRTSNDATRVAVFMRTESSVENNAFYRTDICRYGFAFRPYQLLAWNCQWYVSIMT